MKPGTEEFTRRKNTMYRLGFRDQYEMLRKVSVQIALRFIRKMRDEKWAPRRIGRY